MIAAPGLGKFIQVLAGSAKLNYDGVSYGTASNLQWKYGTVLEMVQGTSNWLQRAAIDIDTNIFKANLGSGEITPTENTALNITANADATGNGGTIDVWVQYVIIDTN